MNQFKYNGQDNDCFFATGEAITRVGDSRYEGRSEYENAKGIRQSVLDNCVEAI
jgi:hypothetical protein